jgi:hypothetical protein
MRQVLVVGVSGSGIGGVGMELDKYIVSNKVIDDDSID